MRLDTLAVGSSWWSFPSAWAGLCGSISRAVYCPLYGTYLARLARVRLRIRSDTFAESCSLPYASRYYAGRCVHRACRSLGG